MGLVCALECLRLEMGRGWKDCLCGNRSLVEEYPTPEPRI